jgi:transposase
MFLRTVRAKSGGKTHEYLRLVETYRHHGKVKQRVIQTLGRKEQLAPHLDSLIQLLSLKGPHRRAGPTELKTGAALSWGPVLVLRHLWEQIGLSSIVRRCCQSRNGRELADRVFVLVCSRLCAPSSEHALAWWLEESFVSDSRGRRYVPVWKRTGRVQVDFRQLNRWYRTLDLLLPGKEKIEQEIYLRLRDLFSVKVDVVFYDVTSTYFEGLGPAPLAQHGYSRDGRPRNPQIQVGVVMASGWPIAHHIFDGKIKDHQTVKKVVSDLRERFEVGKVVFVGDRGMVTRQTMAWLKKEGIPYIVGLRRRRNPRVDALLRATASMEPIRDGDLEVFELESEGAERVVVVKSPERLEYERGMRRKVMRRLWPQLRALEERVRAGKLTEPAKIGAAAQRIVSQSHGERYFSWALTEEGVFEAGIDRKKLRIEKRLEGTYVIATDQRGLSAQEIIQAYKDLAEVERVFRESKDFLQMRPIHHRKESRVRAHLFVVALSFLLYRALERSLKKAGVHLGARQALRALETIRLVEVEVDGETRWLVTRPSHHASAVLKANGLSPLSAPSVAAEVIR